MAKFFITGTGTGVGKTLVTAALCHKYAGRAAAVKPVVSGFAGDPESDPALLLRALGRAVTVEAIAAISPWRFAAPLSPDMAAAAEGRMLALEEIVAFCRAHEGKSELLLVEGAGGVMSPLTQAHTNLDLIAALDWPAVVVAGNYLGSISHTLTALYALHGRGAAVRSVIVSETSAEVPLGGTIETLRRFTGGTVPIYALPKLAGASHEAQWRAAGELLSELI